ncbi:hypothetical protein Fmac_024348 [Flemingia macrophylla]|uniref:non-specific serine/threonine protein kinase n=1 Tax=Flemingia macrophylla TaxID=520843 RepID=A0ABD1LP33_9FABA
MNCFPCCGQKKSQSKREHGSPPPEPANLLAPEVKKQRPDELVQMESINIKVKSYTFRELATATKNFRQDCLIDEGGFGRLYKGIIPATGQVVAVKQLDRNGMQSAAEFLNEVAEISLWHHENLVNLIGYCADGDQRLLVYESFAGRTLENRLFETKADEAPLNWYDRMKIAAAASKGLEYLHESVNPPVIFRDLKASNILIDNDLNARLRDFEMSKLSGGDKLNNAPPRLMGTYGYCAPEYGRGGQLTKKSDAQPIFRDPKRYPDMADPVLHKNFPEKDLNQVVAIASMCLQEEADARPLISDVVTALSFLSTAPVTVPRKVSESDSELKSSKGSHKARSRSSSRSRKGCVSDSGEGSAVSSGKSIRKSSKKSSEKELSQKSSKKSSTKDLSQKSSRKSSIKDLSKKISSRKSSARVSSRNSSSSMGSEEGSMSSSCCSSSVVSEDEVGMPQRSSTRSRSRGNVSFGLNSSRRSESVRSGQSSYESDDGSLHS